MKPARPADRAGAALLTTLILVTAVALVVVSLFAITREEVSLSGATTASARASLGEEAAFAEASARLRSLTANDHYLVTLATAASARYTFISTPDATEVVHTPLFAGGEERRIDLPDFDAMATAVLADASATAPTVAFIGPTRNDAIELPRLTGLDINGAPFEENRRPALGFVELPPSGDSPWLIRYTWWVEDLEGYPNLDVVGARPAPHPEAAARFGYGPTDSRALASSTGFPLDGENGVLFQFPETHRGQRLVDQAAPGLSPREITLQTWTLPGFPAERHPYRDAARLSLERHAIAGARHRLVGDGFREPDRYASGLQPYRVVPTIPYGHGYPDEGQPRFNLNVLVANRDVGGIAEIVERNLPSFEQRKGGFPPGEDYLGTLAANAIDYADEDGRPALPGNTTNAGTRVFRGVDAYCPVNEFFVKFEYAGYREAGPDQWEIEFKATPYAEFWNPFNRTAEMRNACIKFRFIEPIRFLTNSEKYRIEEAHLTSDDAYDAPVSFSVPPNACFVQKFGEIVWRVPVPRNPVIAMPIIQDIRANFLNSKGTELSSPVTTRAHYQLWLWPESIDPASVARELIDQSGRPEIGENPAAPTYGFFFPRHQPVLAGGEHFMRLATPGLAGKAFGFNAGFGAHLGDPWMPYYSRSTFEDAQYRLKGTPGHRNYDHDKVKPDNDRGDWFKDQTRVRDWPDRGYDAALGTPAPNTDAEMPDSFNLPHDPATEAFAPWRLSNAGRFHSITEFGNLHDPVMWIAGTEALVSAQSAQRFDSLRDTSLKSLPPDARPGPMWGGGNTLRIGRLEHALFDRAGMRASQWLDLFHTGFAGTNLGPDGVPEDALYRHHDPRDHQPPPAAPDPVRSATAPSSFIYDPDLNAQGRYSLIHGHLNLNTAPTRFEIETLLRGPFASCDLRVKTDRHDTPEYEREGETGTLRSGLREEAIPRIAKGLMKARPFHGPSHLARVLSELLDRHDALPAHHNDAEAEETFARVFNTTTLSSRHFRLHTAAEVYHATTGEVVGRCRRVREVFLRPIRNADGQIQRVVAETLSSRDP